MRSNIFTGLLFDKQWEAATRSLKPKQFYQLFWELFDYHMSAGCNPPPPHPESQVLQSVSSLLQEQIKKRLVAARVFGKPNASVQTEIFAETVAPVQHGEQHGEQHPVQHLKERKGEERRREEMIGDDGIGEEERGQQAPSAPPPPPKSEENKKAYGEKKNVFLTDGEYDKLINQLKIPEKYIQHFSEKLDSTAYHYPSHAEAIQKWWENDRHKPQWSEGAGQTYASRAPSQPEPFGGTSFDVNEFFRANIRHNMGEDFLNRWEAGQAAKSRR